ncbi:MAG: hypothetical protein J6F31_02290 [Oscillospiraceae bacterium]|nr:hypothetical protein [Oscillospiraceae bacterium]
MNKINIISIALAVISLCLSVFCVVTVTKEKPADTSVTEDLYDTQYVVYIGTNDKDTNSPGYSEEEARKIVDDICLKHFEGYTLMDATGSWTDENHNVTHEYTIVCYFDGADAETVHRAGDEILAALDQNTILIEKNRIEMEYYSGN